MDLIKQWTAAIKIYLDQIRLQGISRDPVLESSVNILLKVTRCFAALRAGYTQADGDNLIGKSRINKRARMNPFDRIRYK